MLSQTSKMDINHVSQIISNDLMPDNALPQYNPRFREAIRAQWSNISTILQADPHLISNGIRFRLAINSPNPLQTLNTHRTFMRFVTGILDNYYQNQVIKVNCSPVILLHKIQEGEVSVLYASQNYQFFETAITIHNLQSKRLFLSRLGQINLEQYTLDTIASFDTKYILICGCIISNIEAFFLNVFYNHSSIFTSI